MTSTNEPVDLLLISCNRRDYLEKTVARFLDDPTPFRLYCWDNGSEDGAADVVASLDDPRVVEKHFSKTNLNQREPCLWFFDRATSDVIGKVDDDILLPPGWTDNIAPLVRKEPRFGMLGCWTFMPEDWNESAARRNVVDINGSSIFRCLSIGGCAFLSRTGIIRRYALTGGIESALPVDRAAMLHDGLISGYPLPILFAHHMDDPRSPHCARKTYLESTSSVTARARGFRKPEDYAIWIAEDAWIRQHYSFKYQLWWTKVKHSETFWGRLRRRVLHGFRPRARINRLVTSTSEAGNYP